MARSSRRSVASSHSRYTLTSRLSIRSAGLRSAVSSAYCIFAVTVIPRIRYASRRSCKAALYSWRVTSSIITSRADCEGVG
jgi:hypothetical protein